MNQNFSEKWLISGLREENYKISLEYFVIEGKKVLKTDGICQKNIEATLKRL